MFLLIDKPKGITSHDVVDRVRTIVSEKRVGHAGTLDPNATGLLVVGVGRDSTKKLGKISKNTTKTYEAEIILGEIRTTDDEKGDVVEKKICKRLDKSKLLKTLNSFLGKQEQIPSKYSSIKLKGKKAYELARKGVDFKLSPRKINIYAIKLIKYKHPAVAIEAKVSSGTYIRALARDIGEKLGCGAYLKNLRRVKVGKYDITESVKLGKLNRENWRQYGFN